MCKVRIKERAVVDLRTITRIQVPCTGTIEKCIDGNSEVDWASFITGSRILNFMWKACEARHIGSLGIPVGPLSTGDP